MNFHRLVLHSMPTIRFAHRYETTHYRMEFEKLPRMFEITYIEKGDYTKETESGKRIFFPSDSIVIEPNLEAHCNTSDAPLHRHFTFAFCADFEIFPYSDSDISARYPSAPSPQATARTAVFPELIEDAKTVNDIESRIKRIITHFPDNSPDKQLLVTGLLFEILSLITEYSLKQIQKTTANRHSYSDMRYVTKAMDYIGAHLREKMTVSEIAEFVSLSEGHLSRMFKSCTGYSLIQYSNHCKIMLVKQLFEAKSISVSDAAQQVGISDEKYLCRLFKKETGISITEYRRLLKTAPFALQRRY